MIEVKPLEPVFEKSHIVFRARVSGHPCGELVEMRFPKSTESYLSRDRYDCWMLALLIPAMEIGQPLHIAGPVSERLLFSLNKHVIPLLTTYNRTWATIDVTAAAFASKINPTSVRVVATGFSGGVDSFVTVKEYTSSSVPESLSLNLLLFNSVGQFGDNAEWFSNDYQVAHRGAQKFGLEIVNVDTNLDVFFRSDFVDSHSIRNLSVALALQSHISTYLYSSGVPYGDTSFREGDIAYLDPILIPLLSTESLTFLSVGGEHRRSSKTRIVSETPESYSTLYVCLRGASQHSSTNCSACSKCLRTIVTLDLLGVLDRYRSVFDMDVLGPRWLMYVRALSSSPGNFAFDILELARQESKTIPRSWKWLAESIRATREWSPPWLRWRLLKYLPTIFVA